MINDKLDQSLTPHYLPTKYEKNNCIMLPIKKHRKKYIFKTRAPIHNKPIITRPTSIKTHYTNSSVYHTFDTYNKSITALPLPLALEKNTKLPTSTKKISPNNLSQNISDYIRINLTLVITQY